MTNPIGNVDRWTFGRAGKDGCISRNAPPFATISGLDADLDPACCRKQFRQGGFHGATTKRFGRLLVRWQNTTRRRARRTFRRKCQRVSATPPHRSSLGTDKTQYPSILLGKEISNHLAAVDALRPERGAMMTQYLGDRGVRL